MPTSKRYERFRALESEGGVPLDAAHAPLAAEAAGDELPFRRCAGCGMDAHRSAAVCEMCGADLRTVEQDAFNRELARERRAADEALAREAADLARRQAAAAAEQRRLRVAGAGALSRPAESSLPGGFEREELIELLGPGGVRRATGKLALGFLIRTMRAVPSAVWTAAAAVLLVAVAYAKATGQFSLRSLFWTLLLLVPLVVGIVVGRPLRGR